jgi:hypothetical protein
MIVKKNSPWFVILLATGCGNGFELITFRFYHETTLYYE